MSLTIGGKIKLDGEREYKAAISEINAALKLHKSEMAALEAEYGKNATSTAALTQKADILDRQFLSQKDKVETLRGALEDTTNKYGEADKKTIAYATSLNRAEADLAKVSTELENTQKQLDPLNQSLQKNMTAADDAAKKQALLSTELKALDAEYANNSNSAEYLAKRQELLGETAHLSQAKVDSLSAALADAARVAGEDSDEYMNLSKSLNAAKEEMYDTKNATNQASDEYAKLSDSLSDAENAAKDMSEESKKLDDESQKLGDGIGDLASKFGLDLPDGIKNALNTLGDTQKAGTDAGGSLTSLAGEMGGATDASGGLASSLGGLIGKGSASGLLGIIAPAAAAVGAILAVGAALDKLAQSSAAEYQDSLMSIRRQTGEITEENEKLVKSLYTENLGEDYADIADAVSLVKTALGDLDGVNLDQTTEQALQLKKAFDVDVQDSVRASSALIRTFGVDSTTAFDALAYGVQHGLDRASDLSDTLIEYSANFSTMGLQIEDMLLILDNGMQNGARNTDEIADAVREFGIRVKEGSKDSSEALTGLGMDARKAQRAIAEGGEPAREAFYQIVAALDEVDDAVLKNQYSIALFGTKYEDASGTVIDGMSQAKDSVIDLNGALENSQVYGFSDAWEKFKRSGQSTLDEFLQPTLELLTPLVDTLTNIFGIVDATLGLLDSASGGVLGTLGETVGALGGVLDLLLAIVERGLKEIGGTIDLLMTPVSALFGMTSDGLASGTEAMHSFADAIRGSGDGAEESSGKVKGAFIDIGDHAENAARQLSKSLDGANDSMVDLQAETDEFRKSQIETFGEMGGAYQQYLKTLDDDTLKKVLEENQKALEENLGYTTDLFTRLKDNTKLSMKGVSDTLLGNQKDFKEWSEGLDRLAEAGVNQGLIDKLRKAGPETKTLVKDMLRGIGTDAKPEAEAELKKLEEAFEKGGLLALEKLDKSLDSGAPTVKKTTESVVSDSIETAMALIALGGFVQVGEDSIGGIIQGWLNRQGELNQTVKTALLAAQSVARKTEGQQSPSKIYAEIAKYDVDGLVKGWDDNRGRYTSAVESTSKAGQNIIKSLLGKSAEQLDEYLKDKDKKIKLNVFDEITLYNELAKQRKISATDREEFEKRSFEAREKLLSEYKELYGLAAKDEIQILKAVRATYEENGAAHAQVNALLLEADESYLNQLSEENEMTAGDIARYWLQASKKYEEGSLAKIEADRKYIEAWKEVHEEVTKLEEEYEKQVLSLQSKHAGNLFEGLSKSTDQALNAFDMQQAAQKQTQTLEKWMRDIGTLMKRGVDENFVAEVQKMGAKSAEEVDILVNMTDEQLQLYAGTWQKNMELARKQAEKELEPLKAETDAKIKELTKGVDINLEELPKSAAKHGKAVIKELKTALDAGIDDVRKSARGVKEAMLEELGEPANKSLAPQLASLGKAKSLAATPLAKASFFIADSLDESQLSRSLQSESADIESTNILAAYGMGDQPAPAISVYGAVNRAISMLNQTAGVISNYEGKATGGGQAARTSTPPTQVIHEGDTYHVTLMVKASELKEIQDLQNLLNGIPQAARARG